jgi:two-component system sensor histidine kinase DesK
MDEPDVGQVEVGQVELATQEASTHLAVRSGSGTRDVGVVPVVVDRLPRCRSRRARSVIAVRSLFRGSCQHSASSNASRNASRNAAVLVWTPVLLLGPVLDLHGSAGAVAFQLAMVLVIAASAVTAALTGGPPWRDVRAPLALSVLVAATWAAATHASPQWLPTWVLVANALPSVLRGRWLLGAVPVVTAASMWAAWAVAPHDQTRVLTEGFVVLLAGLASAAFTALLDTVSELRRTRQELARVAVAEERDRFSRDLHDLLGHTLSVMVVKAQAVRRLVADDPTAAVGHAADIEQIGRRALVDVRQAVDAMRAPVLAEELDGACRALAAAGVDTRVDRAGVELSRAADTLLAWVVREAATNVIRHSGASTCRIGLAQDGGRVALTVVDDGVGAPPEATARRGGLEGLRDRLAAGGGELDVERRDGGFRLHATVPGGRG